MNEALTLLNPGFLDPCMPGGGHKVPAAFYFRTTNAYDLKLVTFIEQLNTDTLTETNWT